MYELFFCPNVFEINFSGNYTEVNLCKVMLHVLQQKKLHDLTIIILKNFEKWAPNWVLQ